MLRFRRPGRGPAAPAPLRRGPGRRRAMLLLALAGLLAGGGGLRAAPPERAVILGGDLAEIAFALGAGGRVVGTDTTATHPPEAAALPKTGYLRRISAEGVLSLSPDLVLAAPAAGPETALAQLRAAGVPVETGPSADGWAGVLPKIAFMGAALGREAEAQALASSVAQRMAAVRAVVAGAASQPATLFLISVGRGAPMAAGTGTAAHEMLVLAGARNVGEGFEGYKPLSTEAAIGLAPEVLLLPAHAVEAAGGLEAAIDLAGLRDTPAVRDGRVIVMDAMLLLGFGPRTPDAVAELAGALHPDLAGRLDP